MAAPSSSDLALAEQHDAEGRHSEAINALARGTRAGSLPCMRELGKRLLTGDRAPFLAAEGARFLTDAANAGDAEAATRVAVLAALGYHRAQNWRDALQWLALAAQRGWQPAREQLTALAGAPGTDWRQLATGIDLSSWGTCPPARELNADPVVRAFEGFATPAVCDWLIARARDR